MAFPMLFALVGIFFPLCMSEINPNPNPCFYGWAEPFAPANPTKTSGGSATDDCKSAAECGPADVWCTFSPMAGKRICCRNRKDAVVPRQFGTQKLKKRIPLFRMSSSKRRQILAVFPRTHQWDNFVQSRKGRGGRNLPSWICLCRKPNPIPEKFPRTAKYCLLPTEMNIFPNCINVKNSL